MLGLGSFALNTYASLQQFATHLGQASHLTTNNQRKVSNPVFPCPSLANLTHRLLLAAAAVAAAAISTTTITPFTHHTFPPCL